MSCGMPFHVVQITSSRPSMPLHVFVGMPGLISWMYPDLALDEVDLGDVPSNSQVKMA